jgi:hypothetical protein
VILKRMTEQIINIDLRYLAESQPSLCIPRVFNNISESKIRQVFDELGLGRISGVDIKERRNEKGDSFKRVYVHFEKWFWNEDAQSVRKKLVSGKEIKVVYDNPWFWKVSASKWTPSRDYEIGGDRTSERISNKQKVRIIDDDHDYQGINEFERKINGDYNLTRKEYDEKYKRLSADKDRYYGDRNYDSRDYNDKKYNERSNARECSYDNRERNYNSRDYNDKKYNERNYDTKQHSYDKERNYDSREHKDYKNIVSKKVVTNTNTNIPSLPYVSSSSSTAPLKLKKKNDLSKKVKPTKKKEKVLLVEEVVEVVEVVKLEKELLKDDTLKRVELEEGELEEEEITLPPLEFSQEQKEILEDLYGDFKKLNL